MHPNEVRAASSTHITFGSHALTHPWLTSLDRAEKAREIHDSFARVEALAGSPPAGFAYPYGNFDRDSERLVEEAGFACACATIPTAVSPASRLFALPRLQVGNWDRLKFERAQALAGA
jgi:peptidoglycan/xylan/chitin deacetylase (PgdA/CDA1 family)